MKERFENHRERLVYNKVIRLTGVGIFLLIPEESQFNTTSKNQHKEHQRVMETEPRPNIDNLY